jgi:hypothetical protein
VGHRNPGTKGLVGHGETVRNRGLAERESAETNSTDVYTGTSFSIKHWKCLSQLSTSIQPWIRKSTYIDE